LVVLVKLVASADVEPPRREDRQEEILLGENSFPQ